MAGNSQRRGAVRKSGGKKSTTVGSGGNNKRALTGRGPTPPAEARTGHPAARRSTAAVRGARSGAGGSKDRVADQRGAARRSGRELPETVVGRNPVVEALRAGVPMT